MHTFRPREGVGREGGLRTHHGCELLRIVMGEGEFLRLRPEQAVAALVQVSDGAEARRLSTLYGVRNGYGPGIFEGWVEARRKAVEAEPSLPALNGVVRERPPAAATGVRVAWAVTALLVLLIAVMWMTQGGMLSTASSLVDGVAGRVADDQVRAYRIASERGSAVDACAAAGLVKAAYLQAKSEAEYTHWSSVERADCLRAGLAAPLGTKGGGE